MFYLRNDYLQFIHYMILILNLMKRTTSPSHRKITLRKVSYYVENDDLPLTYISYVTNIALSIRLQLCFLWNYCFCDN